MAYTTIDDPSVYFQTKLYTGNSAADDANLTTSQALTFDGNSDMQPDLLWFKRRDGADHNLLFDVIRGRTKGIYSNLAQAEDTLANSITSFNSDGFTLGNDTGTGGTINKTDETYVAWGWKAGTAFSNDASGTSIGSIDSAGSVNNDAGFSICTFTGTGSAGTMKHGLNTVPKMIIVKGRSEAKAWTVYHSDLGAGKAIFLEQTAAATTSDAYFSGTEPTSTVFGSGSSTNVSGNGITFVAYCFAQKNGFSKFGSYTGNGNADGTFIYTGFKPAWIMVKCSTTANSYDHWVIYDNKRLGYNIAGNRKIYANSNVAEPGDDDLLDILSNGFKFRNTHSNVNGSGQTFIYMAFAESPFVTSTGIPTTAR
jgi:hypothetical protein